MPHLLQTTYKHSNGSSQIEQHLTTNQPMTSKGADYFKQLLESQNKQHKAFVIKVTVSEKAQEASYFVAELTAEKRKSHAVGEILIMPACKITVCKMLGKYAVRETDNVPLTNSTINRGIDDMSHNAQEVLHDKLKNNSFSI
jgi:hypothetical protein